jgi:15-cis-phytoene synthase
VPQVQIDLERAYAHCDQVTRHHSKSFYLATDFLPHPKRRAIRAFYAFCRVTDDIVDVPRTGLSNLQEWRQAARQPTSVQSNPVLQAWTDTQRHYGVPQQYIEELMDGCELDLQVNRYETFQQLRRYCYLVASTVGLVSMHIIGAADGGREFSSETTHSAVELGIALQLTNILRDVGEDLSRGRIYLPQEDLRAFGYSEKMLCDLCVNHQFRQLMQFEIERTDVLYEQHLPALSQLQPDGRMAVAVAAILYRGILGKIIENDFDVFNQRAHLSRFEKLRRLPRIYVEVQRFGKT